VDRHAAEGLPVERSEVRAVASDESRAAESHRRREHRLVFQWKNLRRDGHWQVWRGFGDRKLADQPVEIGQGRRTLRREIAPRFIEDIGVQPAFMPRLPQLAHQPPNDTICCSRGEKHIGIEKNPHQRSRASR
jgi:hypothetical protein